MAKRKGKTNSRNKSVNRALNAFDAAQPSDEDDIHLSEGDDETSKYLNGEVNSEDDEDIDSDEALGSDDDWEEMVGRKRTAAGSDDNDDSDGGDDYAVGSDEDPEEYDNIDSNELMSLSQIWDMEDKGSSSKKQKVSKPEDISEQEEGGEEDSGSESNNESEESDSELDEEDSADDEIDEEGMKNLREMISGGGDETAKNKKRLEVNNAPEGEFSLPAGDKKISINDLTKSASDTKGLHLVTDKKNKKLSVPLPRRIQERHDRAAAYDLANDQVNKWQDTVNQNREAEHVQFPINPKAQVEKVTSFTPVQPVNDFEQKIQNVLKDSALTDEKAISTFEDLAPAKMSKEELENQLNQRRLMRELALREEKKAKRIKKIKSKSYRRVHKKEREKQADMIESESDEEDHNSKRAKERMTLKHKNTSKWAKNMIDQGFTKDKESRQEMEEMLRRGEALRQKVQGEQYSSDDDEQAIEEEDGRLDQVNKDQVGKGILGMKFMREAEAAEREQNNRMMEEDDIFEEDDKQVENVGRRSYNPEKKESQEEIEEQLNRVYDEMDEDNDKSIETKLSKESKKKPEKSKSKLAVQEEEEEEGGESNPWMTVENKKPLESRKTVDKPKTKRGIRGKKKKEAQQKEKEIDMNQTLDLVDPLSEGNGTVFQQQDLVKRAFAGDDVVEQFQDAKRQRVEADDDKEIDMTLPGWGSWDGAGVKDTSKQKKKIVKKIKGIKADKRKDAKMSSVIINEKQNKRANKFTASTVPYPFETREQYERSLRMPIGQEWTSRGTHQKLTKPRVLVKQGEVVDPIKAPFK